MKRKEKPKYSVWKPLGFMLKHAWHRRKSILWLLLLLVVIETAIHLTELFVVPVVLSKVEQLVPISQLLGTIGVFAGLLILLRGLKGYLDQNVVFGRSDLRMQILADLNDKSCTISYPESQSVETLKLYADAASQGWGNDMATEHIWITLQSLLVNMVGFVIYLRLMSDLNPMLLAVVAVTTALGFFVNQYLEGWSYRHQEELNRPLQHVLYFTGVMENPKFGKDICLFGLGGWISEMRKKSFRLCNIYYIKSEAHALAAAALDVALTFLRNGIAYFYLIHLSLEGTISVSAFLLYFSAFSGFSTWVTGLLDGVRVAIKESRDISKVLRYLNLPEQFQFDGGAEIPAADKWELKLNDVSFRYPGAETDLISHMNLSIAPGEKLAVVGLNGAGKTTLVKLLCGLYDPTEGQILLNGTDIRTFDRRSYYKLFSAVFQDFSLLDLTVSEAVAQTWEKIDMDKVRDAIEKAGLTETVQKLPKGFDTHVGKRAFLDGVELSGGQTQRLMLARALYKDGPILVLDEPTAALDPLAESDLYRKYNDVTAGKTALFISHRLASTRFCDRIIFLENGAVTEEGTHEELLKKGGGYAHLYEVQARYYQEGREFREETENHMEERI